MGFRLRKPPSMLAQHEAYPYQLDAVRSIKNLPYAAIFHEQGLGKTKIATDLLLSWLCEDVVDTVFVVTKKILVQNWVDELATHCFVTPYVLTGDRRSNSLALNSPGLIYVLNYEVVATNLELMKAFLRTCKVGAILDESQKIKNPESALSASFHEVSDQFVRRIIMTGTPVANRPYDIWSQVRFLDGGEALGDSYLQFKKDLDLPTSDTSQDYGERLSSVLMKIKPFSVRETKRTAGLELPEKTILTYMVRLEPNQLEIYRDYRNRMAHEVKCANGLVLDSAEEILKRLLRLVQCASNPVLIDGQYDGKPGKFKKLTWLLDEIKVQENKAIIWTGFVQNIEWLWANLSHLNPLKIHGQMSISDRGESIRKFKTDDSCRLLLATPGAAKEGLTLTVANHAIFYDRGFSLDDYLQAQDRIHRISQTNECFIHNLIARETIDEWVDTLLNAKYQAAQLAQGDISREEFEVAFTNDLSSSLMKILQPEG